MPRKPRTPKQSKTIPKAPSPEARPRDNVRRPVLERVRLSFLNLLTWAETQLTLITAGDLEPGASLIDSIVKALTVASKELPRLDAELCKLETSETGLTEAEEVQGKAILAEAGYDTGDTPMTAEEVAECEAVLADSHKVQVDGTKPMLTTPRQ